MSYGGGVQSTALLVLAATGQIEPRPFLFANVGEDSETWRTLDYVWTVAMPYAAGHGIGLLELQRRWSRGERAGRVQTLRARMMRPSSRSLPIPVRMANGAPNTRSCTASFKVEVIGRLLQSWGATAEHPAEVALGISTDEIQRAHPGIDPLAPYQRRVYPLLDLGLSRVDCRAIIAGAGLPVPAKSACYFCPYHDTESWRRLKREDPDDFDRACELEDTLNARRDSLGKDHVWLTRHAIPLRQAFADDQLTLDLGTGDCESGWCMT